MNAQSSRFAVALQPLSLVAILALVLAAAFAVATGGRPLRGPVGRGAAHRDAIADAIARRRSARPRVARPSPSSPTAITVDLIENVGADATIDITDLSGTLVSAVSGNPGDGASVPDGRSR